VPVIKPKYQPIAPRLPGKAPVDPCKQYFALNHLDRVRRFKGLKDGVERNRLLPRPSLLRHPVSLRVRYNRSRDSANVSH
jgi:hypothetical protein